MLEGYFDAPDVGVEKEEHQRLLAVQAALEIAKHSVGSPGGAPHSRVDQDLESVTDKIEALADAIQKALAN